MLRQEAPSIFKRLRSSRYALAVSASTGVGRARFDGVPKLRGAADAADSMRARTRSFIAGCPFKAKLLAVLLLLYAGYHGRPPYLSNSGLNFKTGAGGTLFVIDDRKT